MKTTDVRLVCFGMTLALSIFLLPRDVFSQTTDSLNQASSDGALQFQLINGLGVYYATDGESGSYVRIGFDGSFSHYTSSSDESGYHAYSSSPGTPSQTTYAQQPENKSTTFTISLSGVYVLRLVRYANASLYCAVGPMVSLTHGKGSNSTPYTRTNAGVTEVGSYANSSTSKSWGIGPVALIGVRHFFAKHVGLSAEMSVSALHSWTSSTSISRSTYITSPTVSSVDQFGSSSSSKGWSVTLSNIRIGVVVDL